MEREVVEVVARFAGTILDVAHVAPTGTYRIGTAPDVDFVVPGLTSFPLVDGCCVRSPVGMTARDDGAITELRAGAITLRVARTKLPTAALVRPRFDWSVPAFVLASLVLHLAVWLVAMRFEPLEKLPSEKPRRYVRLIAPPAPPPPPTKRVEQKLSVPREEQRVQSARAAPRARPMPQRADTTGMMAAAAALEVARAAQSFDDTRVVERVSALPAEGQYDEDAANAEGFGGGRRFDPSQREGFGSVETGAYATMPFNVKLCPNRSCRVVGPVPALYVRTHLLAHMNAIYNCYDTYAEGPGTIVLEFTITGDGAVRDARGSGLGETGACAARVASEIVFRAFGRETRVRYPVRFK